jgi:acetyl esterase/lipase
MENSGHKTFTLPRIGNLSKALIVLLFMPLVAAYAGFGEQIAVRLFYREAVLPEHQVHKELIYWTGPDTDLRKHRLDFYVPKGRDWPVLIFVHGGSWRSGDKALQFGAADPYGNIGRFYAARGIGVAVINYRLQPRVTWREQIKDVARALAWVHKHVDDYGADKGAIFLFGHSSGAQLATRAALDRELLGGLGFAPEALCGVIAVSGAPFDIADDKTYELGTDPMRYEKPFRAGDTGDRWKYEASSVNFVTPSAPPFLLLHGRWEPKGLQRQNQLMYQALTEAGVSTRLVVAPWESHALIVAALSHPNRMVSAAILDFIRSAKRSG